MPTSPFRPESVFQDLANLLPTQNWNGRLCNGGRNKLPVVPTNKTRGHIVGSLGGSSEGGS